jgi:hypothetical protein
VGDQCLFEHRQGDALLFEFDDTVQPPEQFETPVGSDTRGVGGVLDMPGRQVGRGDQQGAVAVLA